MGGVYRDNHGVVRNVTPGPDERPPRQRIDQKLVVDDGGVQKVIHTQTFLDTADNIDGSTGQDMILAGGGNDVVRAGQGDDRVDGEDGDDTLIGGEGDDCLMGGAGSNLLEGGYGADTLVGGGDGVSLADYSHAHGGVAVRLDGTGSTGDEAQGDVFINIAGVLGSAHDDKLYGDDSDNLLVGNGGNDLIGGGWGDDRLFGGDGDDTLR